MVEIKPIALLVAPVPPSAALRPSTVLMIFPKEVPSAPLKSCRIGIESDLATPGRVEVIPKTVPTASVRRFVTTDRRSATAFRASPGLVMMVYKK